MAGWQQHVCVIPVLLTVPVLSPHSPPLARPRLLPGGLPISGPIWGDPTPTKAAAALGTGREGHGTEGCDDSHSPACAAVEKRMRSST